VSAPAGQLRILLGAFGDPGHVFPLLALGERLVQRGHDVTLQSWRGWEKETVRCGIRFAAAPEYKVFPTREQPLKPYEAVVRATTECVPLLEELRPQLVVSDILTLAPALAAEIAGLPRATLVPHVFPVTASGMPPYSVGAVLPRSAAGRFWWRRINSLSDRGLRLGRRELNETRRRLGLPPQHELHGGLSRQLTMVATFPQLEYPRQWPSWAQVIGPLLWEPPAEDVQLPEGDEPLVLIAPSTSQDREHVMLRAALEGLADLPVRVLASWNRRAPSRPLPTPANARLVEWVSYARTMPKCDLVVCHAGHGTVARAIASGCAVVAVPSAGDMNENAARVDWAGVGVRLPRRFVTGRALRLAVGRALSEPRLRSRAGELQSWLAEHDSADRACELLEGLPA
jgi:MGT family glycosyltransferase